jgi:hypothetical protein
VFIFLLSSLEYGYGQSIVFTFFWRCLLNGEQFCWCTSGWIDPFGVVPPFGPSCEDIWDYQTSEKLPRSKAAYSSAACGACMKTCQCHWNRAWLPGRPLRYCIMEYIQGTCLTGPTWLQGTITNPFESRLKSSLGNEIANVSLSQCSTAIKGESHWAVTNQLLWDAYICN